MTPAVKLPSADYEPRDASVRIVVGVAIGLAAGLALSLAIAAGVYRAQYRSLPRLQPFGRQSSFRESTKVRTSIAADWAIEDAAVRQHLETYGWVDRNSGIVRIPVARAIDRLVEESAAAKGALR
jgi:hypothetical protein